VLPLAL